MVKSTNRSRDDSDLFVRQPTDQKAGGSNPSRRAKNPRNRKISGILFCISCYFRLPPFSDPNADPNGSGQRKASDNAREDIAHGLGGFQLRVGGNVGVGVQREACGVVAQHGGYRFHIHTVLECHGGEGVPLRYNYDKPEKPRISRVFGYLARFFILFQTEKSSREVVIS